MPKHPARKTAPKFAIAIMAAGKGTRLKSRHPKVLHQIAGKPLLRHVIDAALQVVAPTDVYAIVGHEAERVREAIAGTGVQTVLQAEQRGTGHAIISASPELTRYEHVLVLSGDTPLIRPDTIRRVRDFHVEHRAAMTILTAELDDPAAYGRILRKTKGRDEVAAIVEHKALQPRHRSLREINSGIYAFATKPLFAHLHELGTDNAHHEYYLTDMAAILTGAKEQVVALKAEDTAEVLGINNRAELAQLDALLRMRKCEELMAAGVTIYRPETCVIDADVTVAPDTVIEPFVQLHGNTRIGADCHIRSYSVISDCEIAAGVHVRQGCLLEDSRIDAGAILGPYCHVRPGSQTCEGAHVGNFLQTKKARIAAPKPIT